MRRSLVFFLSLVVAAACSANEPDVGGATADVTAACEVVSAKDGHKLTAAEIAALGDPVAKLVLQGDGCPKDLAEISQKLSAEPCEGAPGTGTRYVSERTSLLDVPDANRTVISRQCGGRRAHELMMSASVHAGPGGDIASAKLNGDFVELIGERRDASTPDRVSGVFNFYARESGRWTFFGSSEDLLSEGYTCNADGACIPKTEPRQRCAGCHVGGGLVMKELENPWTFWEASRGVPMPGSVELTAKFSSVFGKRLNGTELEATVRAGNAEWANARLALLERQGLRELLRPLFCTMDMNLESPSHLGTDVGVPLPQVLNGHVFLDPIWPSNPPLPSNRTFHDAEAAINQRVIDSVTKKPIRSDGEVVRRSSLPAPGALSIAHREALLAAGIVDADLVKDILAVDLTRPQREGE